MTRTAQGVEAASPPEPTPSEHREIVRLLREDPDLQTVRLCPETMQSIAGPALVEAWMALPEPEMRTFLETQRLGILRALVSPEVRQELKQGFRRIASKPVSQEIQAAATKALDCLTHPYAPEANPVHRIVFRISLDETLANEAYRSVFFGAV